MSDLIREVDAKYIISVIELLKEEENYYLFEEDLRVISNYIEETCSAFAVVDDTPISEVQNTTTKKKTTKAKTSYEPMPDGDAELVTVVSKRVKVHDGGGSAV